MILSQIVAQTAPHQPVPIHIVTWENVALFLKFFWLVNRALWPVWAFLAVGAVVKLVVMRVRRTRWPDRGRFATAATQPAGDC